MNRPARPVRSARSRANGKEKEDKVPLSETITLGGRRFVMSNRLTFRQDARGLDLAEKLGLEDLFSNPKRYNTPETRGHLVRRMVIEGYRTGVLFDLLATIMVEEGQERWDPEKANEVSEFIANLTEPKDKEFVSTTVVAMVVNFFVAARQSLANFPSSSTTGAAREASTTDQTEGLFTAETGQESSAP